MVSSSKQSQEGHILRDQILNNERRESTSSEVTIRIVVGQGWDSDVSCYQNWELAVGLLDFASLHPGEE